MSGDSMEYDANTIASEAFLQQLEGDSLGNQFVDSEIGESVADTVWHGLTFKLEEINLVIPCSREPTTGELEVALCGEVSPLPLVKNWIKGMIYIRGEIYTVVDFSAYLGAKERSVVAGCNLVLLPDSRLKSALLIDDQVCLQSFDMNLPVADVETLDCALTPYLSRVLIDNGQNWGVIDVDALSNSAQFSRIGKDSDNNEFVFDINENEQAINKHHEQ